MRFKRVKESFNQHNCTQRWCFLYFRRLQLLLFFAKVYILIERTSRWKPYFNSHHIFSLNIALSAYLSETEEHQPINIYKWKKVFQKKKSQCHSPIIYKQLKRIVYKIPTHVLVNMFDRVEILLSVVIIDGMLFHRWRIISFLYCHRALVTSCCLWKNTCIC